MFCHFLSCKHSAELLREILDNQELIIEMLTTVLRGERIMSAELDALTAQVAQNTAVEASAVTLIQGLAAQISAAHDDPAAVKALADQLHASADALAAAVAANTVAPAPAPADNTAPAPAPEPAPADNTAPTV